MTPPKPHNLDKRNNFTIQNNKPLHFKIWNLKHSVKKYKHWAQNVELDEGEKQFSYQKLTEEGKNEKQTRCDTCQACNCQGHSNKGYKDDNKKSWNIVIFRCSRKVEHIWNVLYTYMHKNKKLTFC